MTKPPIAQAEGKREQVEAMFDDIAPRYDLLNHVLSMGVDFWWRKQAVKLLGEALGGQPECLLDVATGTADLAIEALSLHPEKVVGVDISEGMLQRGRTKIDKKGLSDRIELLHGDAANLPFEDDYFDGALSGFGVRNFENLSVGVAGIQRVLKPGSPFLILEFSHPNVFPVKQAYELYSSRILPWIGKTLSKNKDAYEYLPESVSAFPDSDEFLGQFKNAGFTDISEKRLTFGMVSLYCGRAV